MLRTHASSHQRCVLFSPAAGHEASVMAKAVSGKVFAALRRHSSHPDVVVAGLKAVMVLASVVGDEVIAAGAPQMAVAALRRFPADLRVVGTACSSIAHAVR